MLVAGALACAVVDRAALEHVVGGAQDRPGALVGCDVDHLIGSRSHSAAGIGRGDAGSRGGRARQAGFGCI